MKRRGYLPGAFTGVHKNGSPGRLREADGGNLLLDGIGDIPLALQTRLLQLLQERQIEPAPMSALWAYRWPGNLHQYGLVIKTAVVLLDACETVIFLGASAR